MATRMIEDMVIGDVECWLERFSELVLANFPDASPRRKVALLLSNIGPKGYKLLRSFAAPDTPASKTFEELADMLINHLAPRPSATNERYKLNTMSQIPNETLVYLES